MEDRAWELDSFRHERPFEVMWGRSEIESGFAGSELPLEEPAAGAVPAC
jgi:hypothetical protein